MIGYLDCAPDLRHRLGMATRNRKVLVYVAGPYNADTAADRGANCKAASDRGAQVVNLGGFPVVPHRNTGDYYGMRDEGFFLDGCVELMLRCDAMFVLPNWKDSLGAQLEVKAAFENGIPVLENVDSLQEYLEQMRVMA